MSWQLILSLCRCSHKQSPGDSFYLFTLSSCKWLCWQDCDPLGSWQTGSWPAPLCMPPWSTMGISVWSVRWDFFFAQSASVKLVTMTCGHRGAQSLHLWFSLSASPCPGWCRLAFSFLNERECDSSLSRLHDFKLWCCIRIEHYNKIIYLKAFHVDTQWLWMLN